MKFVHTLTHPIRSLRARRREREMVAMRVSILSAYWSHEITAQEAARRFKEAAKT